MDLTWQLGSASPCVGSATRQPRHSSPSPVQGEEVSPFPGVRSTASRARTVTLAAGFKPASTYSIMGRCLSGEHKVRPYAVTMGRSRPRGVQRGEAPLHLFSVPLSERGIKGDWLGGCGGEGHSPRYPRSTEPRRSVALRGNDTFGVWEGQYPYGCSCQSGCGAPGEPGSHGEGLFAVCGEYGPVVLQFLREPCYQGIGDDGGVILNVKGIGADQQLRRS